MNDWFDWNGVRSTALGVRVLAQPPRTLAAERVKTVTVPGRSGSLSIAEGEDVYDDLLLSADCIIDDPDEIAAVADWLRGAGEVMFANRVGGHYRARVVNQIAFENIVAGNPLRQFTVQFRCDPFFYPDVDAIVLNAPGVIENPYAYTAYPVVTVYGSGARETLMIGGHSILIDGVANGLIIDCENLIAWLDESGTNAAERITIADGARPALAPGTNGVNWTSGINRVEIMPNWRNR